MKTTHFNSWLLSPNWAYRRADWARRLTRVGRGGARCILYDCLTHCSFDKNVVYIFATCEMYGIILATNLLSFGIQCTVKFLRKHVFYAILDTLTTRFIRSMRTAVHRSVHATSVRRCSLIKHCDFYKNRYYNLLQSGV